LTHHDLVESAYKWVLKNGSCGVAFKELYTLCNNGEYPDVIGFGGWGHSVLIECKMSRSDFAADKKKPFRIYPDLGMGSYRFYCTPKNLINIEDLPNDWGLLWVDEKLKARCIYKLAKGNLMLGQPLSKNIKAEHELMYSALRRLQIRGRVEEIYLKES
jgi:hypothetical protein